ncbi:MAG: TatD family hydrolase [Candidatus Thermoplasmatota archaeon]|nr:TatD family hydrolase [Candidatus Thermoplasmatota archaeon]
MHILDNHFHISPAGRNVEAAKEFERAGGTHLIIAHLPHKEHRIEKDRDHGPAFELTLSLAEGVRRGTGLSVFVTVGPYPVELIRLVEHMPLPDAVEIMKSGMETAANLVEEGRTIAIGEIGRPHFPVDSEILQASNEIMSYGMKLAAEVGCPVVLHTESATPEVFRELALMADASGLERGKVVKHFSTPFVDTDRNSGLFPSIVSSRRNIAEAISQGNRFLMETDYLDDLKRPGAVLGPATVPKRTKAFLGDSTFTEEDALKIHKDNPELVYGERFD